MYCKKCGTKQKGGYKYCPKCGTPFLDESQKLSPEMTANERGWAIYSIGKAGEQVTEERIRYYVQRQREEAIHPTAQGNSFGNNSQIQSPIPNGVNDNPYQMHSDTNSQSIKERIESKAEELSIKGKRLIDEKVRPRFDEKVEDLKNVNWDEKKTKSVNMLQDFFSNTNKLRRATIIIALVAVLWFFIFNHGFSASWAWWIFAVSFIVAAFYKVESCSETDALKKARWSFGLAILLGFVLITHNSNSSSSIGYFDADGVNVKANNDRDMEILSKMASIRGEIKSILPQVESLYNAHQEHMARGFQYASSPAWGRWQDCNQRIDNLWNEYIKLARQLSGNNDDVIEEARESKRTMDKAFNDMFGPHY